MVVPEMRPAGEVGRRIGRVVHLQEIDVHEERLVAVGVLLDVVDGVICRRTFPRCPWKSQVVDLLPTRSADSLGEWLAQHPGVTTVSRDRQGVYAEGTRRVAPTVVQVADRFHLVLNLTQAVERELAVNRRQLRIASPSAPALPPSPTTEEMKSRSKPIRVRSSVMMQ